VSFLGIWPNTDCVPTFHSGLFSPLIPSEKPTLFFLLPFPWPSNCCLCARPDPLEPFLGDSAQRCISVWLPVFRPLPFLRTPSNFFFPMFLLSVRADFSPLSSFFCRTSLQDSADFLFPFLFFFPPLYSRLGPLQLAEDCLWSLQQASYSRFAEAHRRCFSFFP